MKICKASDYKEMSRKAAKIIAAQITMKPDCVLGLATGSTPIGLYKYLVKWYRKGDLDFSEVVNLSLQASESDSHISHILIYYPLPNHLEDTY